MKFIVLLASWFLIVWSVQAEELPLNLKKAFILAYHNNPQFKVKQSDLDIAAADVVTANLFEYNPSLLSDNGVGEKTYRLGIKQVFPLTNRRSHRVKSAVARQRSVEQNVENERLHLKSEVRKAYVQLYLSQQRYQALKVLEAKLQKMEQVVSANPKHRPLEVMKVEIQQLEVGKQVKAATQDVLKDSVTLSSMLNQPVWLSWRLEPPQRLLLHPVLPLTPEALFDDSLLESMIRQALNHRPDLVQKQFDLKAVKEQMIVLKKSQVPDLHLTVGPDLVTEPGEREWGVFVIMTMDIPIFNRQQGLIQKSIARQVQLEREQAALKNQIVQQVITAYISLASQEAQLAQYEVNLMPKLKVLNEMNQKEFEKTQNDVMEVITSEETYLEKTIDYWHMFQDYQNSVGELEKAIGNDAE